MRVRLIAYGVLAAGLAVAGIAVAVVRSSHPVRPLPTSHPIRITITRGCPSKSAQFDGVENPTSEHLDSVLAPGNPQKGLICRYAVRGAPAGFVRLYRSVSLIQTEAKRLVSELDRIPPAPSGAVSCGTVDNQDEEFNVLVFAYPGRADVDLLFSANTCTTVVNGYLGRLEITPPIIATFNAFETDFNKLAGRSLRGF